MFSKVQLGSACLQEGPSAAAYSETEMALEVVLQSSLTVAARRTLEYDCPPTPGLEKSGVYSSHGRSGSP